MTEYAKKHHKIICETFRYMSFVMVCITLILFIMNLWLENVPKDLFSKTFITTLAILLSSGVVKIIFTPDKSKN